MSVNSSSSKLIGAVAVDDTRLSVPATVKRLLTSKTLKNGVIEELKVRHERKRCSRIIFIPPNFWDEK